MTILWGNKGDRMKRLLPLVVPVLMWGQSYSEVISRIDKTVAVQSAERLEKAAYETYLAAEGKSLPSVDARLSVRKLAETPTVTFGSATMPMGTRNGATGELALTYPLFTGFALAASIEKAKLSHEKTVLQVAELKRNLYISATRLYSLISSSDTVIEAHAEAKKAIEDSLEKAKGLFENGLLPPSALSAIEAKAYEIDAQLTEARHRKRQALNQLSYLSGTEIESARISESLLPCPPQEEIMRLALSEREDLLGIAKALDIAESEITLAQSRYYPNIAAVGALKRQGDSLKLNGDGYTNADQSYAGVSASWNLFSGLSDIHTTQGAKAGRLAAHLALEDYKQRIAAEIKNAYLDVESLRSRLKSARMQTRAAEEYDQLTRGRFDNQLASADEVSRAISDLAAAKAKTADLEAELFNQTATLWLRGGLNAYRQKVLPILP